MPKGESTAAAVEVDFLADHRLHDFTDAQKIGYLAYWFTAVRERRSYLPNPIFRPKEVARRHFLHIRSVQGAFQKAITNGLMSAYRVDGCIYVCVWGVRDKHSYLHNWHTEEDGEVRGKIGANSPLTWGEIGASCRVVSDRVVSLSQRSPKVPPESAASSPSASPLISRIEHAWGRSLSPGEEAQINGLLGRFPWSPEDERWAEALAATVEIDGKNIRCLKGCLERGSEKHGGLDPVKLAAAREVFGDDE